MAKVLVVEDDSKIAKICEVALKLEGHQPLCAESGHKALECLRSRCPDVIVLDLEMPVMDGRSFAKKLEMVPNRPPVVILSAFEPRSAQEELRVEEALKKPFDPLELAEKVSRLAASRDSSASNAGFPEPLKQMVHEPSLNFEEFRH